MGGIRKLGGCTRLIDKFLTFNLDATNTLTATDNTPTITLDGSGSNLSNTVTIT